MINNENLSRTFNFGFILLYISFPVVDGKRVKVPSILAAQTIS